MGTDSLDKAFVSVRQAIKTPSFGTLSRTYLLELLELHASKWQHSLETEEYYTKKYNVLAFGNSPAKVGGIMKIAQWMSRTCSFSEYTNGNFGL